MAATRLPVISRPAFPFSFGNPRASVSLVCVSCQMDFGGRRSAMESDVVCRKEAQMRPRAAANADVPFVSSAVADVSNSFVNPPSPDVLEVWKNADAVCFDVDSTVCEDEGIDELAAFCGAGEAVAAWTERAMGGSVPFEVALASRLDLFKPSTSTLASFLANRPPRLSPGIVDLVSKLHSRGTDVYLVSGGFRQMIEPAAMLLQIPKERIYANNLLFKEDGEFGGFDANEPTSRSGGKAKVIEKVKQECGYKTLAMVGDGATDLEVSEQAKLMFASGSMQDISCESSEAGKSCFDLFITMELAKRPGGADAFICYGGVVARPKVVAGADWFVSSFADLIESA